MWSSARLTRPRAGNQDASSCAFLLLGAATNGVSAGQAMCVRLR